MRNRLLAFLSTLALVGLGAYGLDAYAHRSGCHAAHSCPSDTGSYVCGDTGNCSACPDNKYCKKKKPRPPISAPVSPTSTTPIPSAATTTSSTVQTNASVVRVVDGDTIVALVDGQTKNEMVRFLGINTPETVDPRTTVECFGKEASARMHVLLDGKRIRLESDVQADERDKYGRLLRNVFLTDGTDVNASMVRDGYAYAYLSFPLNPKRKQELKKLQEDAKLNQIGLWSPTTCNGQK